MKRLNLSDNTVERLPLASTTRVTIHDGKERGLLLVIGKRHKSWVFRTRASYHTLGNYPELSTEQARQAVQLLRVENTLKAPAIAQVIERLGESLNVLSKSTPNAQAVSDRQLGANNENMRLPTLSAALNDYIQARGLKPNTVKDMSRRVKSVLNGEYFDRIINELNADVFGAWYQVTSATKPAQAAATGRYLRALFKWSAVAYDMPTLTDPTAKVRIMTGDGFNTDVRDSRLTTETLRAWWQAVRSTDNSGRLALITYLMTGIRRNELIGLTVDSVTLNGGSDDTDNVGAVLNIQDTKNGKSHAVILGKRLSLMWRVYLTEASGTDRLFKESDIRKATDYVKKHLGADAVTVHDLRRSFASFAHAAGCDSLLIKAMLNHTPNSNDVTARHYLRVSPEAMAAGWQTVEDFLFNIIEENDHE